MTKTHSILKSLILSLPQLTHRHNSGSETHTFLKQVARKEIYNLFSSRKTKPVEFEPFGRITFPYHKMGAIGSLNLFDIDELIIFCFYWVNRKKYHKVLDIGANLGLHSIILDKCGYEVRAYEPDPRHFKILNKNLLLNKSSGVHPFNLAVSNKSGSAEFIRVCGNTTGSHIAGSKFKPYGRLEKFPVSIVGIKSIMGWADLIKLDVEGHEKEILLSTNKADWMGTDALVEVENETNARLIYKHFKFLKVKLFSQKNNWNEVIRVNEMPTSYREGTLFITHKYKMPW